VCNNCGLKGHVFRECRKPVMSYGHMIFTMDRKTQEPKILMILRKDSLCYTELLRGKYDIRDLSYLQTLVDKCSNGEKNRLITRGYDDLWKHLWRLETLDQMNPRFKGDYIKGKGKFELVNQGIVCRLTKEKSTFATLVDRSNTSYQESEWEFPKGRRNSRETNKACAIREFCEETGYTPEDYSLLLNVKPFEEEYMGENKVRYKHVYYLGYLQNTEKLVGIDETNESQISEIKDIRWVTKSEALEIIREYHHTRYQVIHQMFDFLRDMDQEYYIVEERRGLYGSVGPMGSA
jgi:8-oxo-dGTP pyrophosphatase MutT (NUDIX family)